MRFRTAAAVLVLALFALEVSARADEKSTSLSAQRLAALKSLAGDWVAADKDGKPTDAVVSSIRVTAGGNTVQETLFPGTEKEMVTMYHLDGDGLILTHYCMLGNQPRMRAESGGDVKKIAFKFLDGTNLKSSDDQHMHEATLTIQDKDHFKAEWVGCKDGKVCHNVTLDFVRKQK
jgi:hypothetical protein